MIKILQVTETIEDGNLLQDMYKCERFIKDIIKTIEEKQELNIDDYKFVEVVFEKVRKALQKVNNIINV